VDGVTPTVARPRSSLTGVLTRLVLQRFGWSVLVLWAISLLIFFATQGLPGDAAQAILGRDATPERLAALREQLNLGQPVLQQYWEWLRGAVTLDFGTSLSNGAPVSNYIGGRIGNTLILVVLAALLAVPVSLVLGGLAGYRRGRASDRVISGVSLVIAALPEFVIGSLLVLLTATGFLRILPATSLQPSLSGGREALLGLVLPSVTLALAISPYIVRMARAVLGELLDSEFVLYARLTGDSEREVLVGHALRNGTGSIAQVVALQLAYLAGGVVVVEYLFGFPGLGTALVEAVSNRDLPVVQAACLFLAGFYVLVNLAADVLTTVTTPRAIHR
jgi:peptide/nickel transport system permease protein